MFQLASCGIVLTIYWHHMEKEMLSLTVKTEEGLICIEQENDMQQADSVRVNPEQVPILIQWLQEAAAELLKK